uniref:glycoside hydrolase family 10 protein n=1 Tax=Romboutsia lituseburensis TaxID=1537 RepID=UPI0022EB0E54
MKKIQSIILSLMMVLSIFSVEVSANSSEEMRAAWISTVYNMDWPSTKNNQAQQEKEYIDLLDKLKSTGINTVVVQVRPKGDAIYKSSINPWSEYLTGTQGKDPGYDPLPFLIQEAHNRGMEFHAWFNPYRVTTDTTDLNRLSSNHPARKHPDWVLEHNNGKYKALAYNPGLPEVRQHIVDSVSEVVKNYDVDGVHFDDYFYRDGMNDDATYNKYGNGMSKNDWRRENVNSLLREVKASIKKINPNVEFGVSPAGIWRNKSSDATGSDTRGQESYSDNFADTRAWIRQGLVDYVVPQIYWPIGNSAADYSKLVSWWANEVKGSNVDLYIGQGVYKRGQADYSYQDVAGEIKQQVSLNRKYSEIKGSMYFSARDIVNNTKLQNDMKELYSSSNQSKWIKENNNWYLIKSNGSKASNEWVSINGNWYRFESSGRMLENQWYKDA